jgi:hypothetical protein
VKLTWACEDEVLILRCSGTMLFGTSDWALIGGLKKELCSHVERGMRLFLIDACSAKFAYWSSFGIFTQPWLDLARAERTRIAVVAAGSRSKSGLYWRLLAGFEALDVFESRSDALEFLRSQSPTAPQRRMHRRGTHDGAENTAV